MTRKKSFKVGPTARMIMRQIGKAEFWGKFGPALEENLQDEPRRDRYGRSQRKPFVFYEGLEGHYGKNTIAKLTYRYSERHVDGEITGIGWRAMENDFLVKEIPQSLEIHIKAQGIEALTNLPHLQDRRILKSYHRPGIAWKTRFALDPKEYIGFDEFQEKEGWKK